MKLKLKFFYLIPPVTGRTHFNCFCSVLYLSFDDGILAETHHTLIMVNCEI